MRPSTARANEQVNPQQQLANTPMPQSIHGQINHGAKRAMAQPPSP